MDKRIVIACMGFLLFSTLLGLIPLQEAHASVTQTIKTSAYDAYVYASGTNYTSVWNQPSGTSLVNNATAIIGGQRISSGTYYIYRSFFYFDTSSIPTTASISAAIFSLYIGTDDSATDFNVTIQNGQPTFPHAPLEVGDYNKAYYSGNGGSRSTVTASSGTWWNITFTTTGLTWIQKGTSTKLTLRSSHDINGTAPTTLEYLIFRSYEAGEAYAAKLYITCTGGITYLIHGPFYEDGTTANVLVNLTIHQPYADEYKFSLDGAGGVDTANISLFQPADYLIWNITTTGNYTRTYYFLPSATFEEVWVFVPKASKPWYAYTFTITDFYGMTTPFLETTVSLNGTQRVVERKSLSTVSAVVFSMVQWSHYGLRFRCDQGTYMQHFDAETTWSVNLLVPTDAFPTTSYTVPTASATRINGSIIEISYVDPTNATAWFYYAVKHGSIVESTDNLTTNSYSINWTSGVSEVDYVVEMQSYSGRLRSWSLTVAAPLSGVNPWDGLFESLGTFPTGFEPMYLPAIVIVLCVLGIFSYFSSGVGCVLAWIVTGVFILMGWYTQGIPIYAFAGFVSILVAVSEGKKQEREV